MSAARRKGTSWETAIVEYLRANGVPYAERRVSNGTRNDRGDVAGVPGVVISAKSCARLELSGWLDEAETQRANDRADHAAVWHKRRGKGSPAAAYVTLTGAAYVQLLTAAGYIAEPVTHPTPGAVVRVTEES